MSSSSNSSDLPGVSVGEKPRRFVPTFHWELLVGGVEGQELMGLEARTMGGDARALAREIEGGRWSRCRRCDSWRPLPEPPAEPTTDAVPPLDKVELPLR